MHTICSCVCAPHVKVNVEDVIIGGFGLTFFLAYAGQQVRAIRPDSDSSPAPEPAGGNGSGPVALNRRSWLTYFTQVGDLVRFTVLVRSAICSKWRPTPLLADGLWLKSDFISWNLAKVLLNLEFHTY